MAPVHAGAARVAVAFLAAAVLAGCATQPRPTRAAGASPSKQAARSIAQTVAPGEPVASAADPAGRITGYQFARRYQDVVKVDGGSVAQTVEYGFDYDRRVTVRRIFDTEGRQVAEDLFEAESLHANAAESARVRELVETHPQLGPLMAQPNLHVHAGGFVVREPGDPYCDTGLRCLRFIVSKGDGSQTVIHAIVDLVSDRVVYPFVKT